MRKAKLFIHQDPVAKGRARFTRGGFAFTPAKTRAAETALKYEMKTKFQEKPFDAPIKVEINFGIERPKTVKRRWPSVKPDIDNFIKQIFDAGNGILWVDDYLIISVVGRKAYAAEGFVEIAIEEVCD